MGLKEIALIGVLFYFKLGAVETEEPSGDSVGTTRTEVRCSAARCEFLSISFTHEVLLHEICFDGL